MTEKQKAFQKWLNSTEARLLFTYSYELFREEFDNRLKLVIEC